MECALTRDNPKGVFKVCTENGADFANVAQALRVGLACADYLNASDASGLEPAALGEVLVSVGEIQTKLAVAYAEFLFRFDAQDGHEADGRVARRPRHDHRARAGAVGGRPSRRGS